MGQVHVTAVSEAPAQDASYEANVGDVVCRYKTIGQDNVAKGFIRVESSELEIQNGWMNQRKRSALLKGTFDLLNSQGFSKGQKLPGKIVVTETTEAPYDGAEPKKRLNRDGSVGEVMTHNGQPIYRLTDYNPNPEAPDTFLVADGTEAASPEELEGSRVEGVDENA